MVKMLLGAFIILISIAISIVAILLWIVPEPYNTFEFWMLMGAVIFLLASGIFVGALFIERGIRERS